MRISAVVLCAGLSSRLPGFKPLLRLGGQSLLARAGELFRSAGVTDIVAVTGHRADEVRAEALACGLRPVHNPAYREGMFGSARAGLAAVGPDAQAAFVLPVDIPLVRPSTLRALLLVMESDGSEVLLPTFISEPGHPPLLHASAFPKILNWTGGQGLVGALGQFAPRQVPVADANILFDVDDESAFAEAEVRYARLGIPTAAEALVLLHQHKAGERGLAHGRGVAQAALAIARALNAKGLALDLGLIESAALLHDIAKGQPRHEAAGASLLASLGFGPVAEIVAAHRDIDPAGLAAPSERDIVYLADKLVRGPERIGIARRFQEKLDAFAGNEDACRAIRTRRDHALAMQRLVESRLGCGLGACSDSTAG